MIKTIPDFLELEPLELIKGYFYAAERKAFCCAVCGKEFHEDEVFSFGERYYTAEKAARIHIEEAHPGLLNELLSVDKRYLSVTENQSALLRLMGQGLPDNAIAKRLSVSPSTVRHQRFVFREKAKQAKLFLAVYGLASSSKRRPQEEVIEIHSGVTMLDDRFVITRAEQEKILSLAFSSLNPLKLLRFPPKEKKKVVILDRISAEFQPGKQYTEKEINAILKEIFDDYATLRRYLIEYGYLERLTDCSFYWVKGSIKHDNN